MVFKKKRNLDVDSTVGNFEQAHTLEKTRAATFVVKAATMTLMACALIFVCVFAYASVKNNTVPTFDNLFSVLSTVAQVLNTALGI